MPWMWLCATACPQDAIKLEIREKREKPFERVLELGMAILNSKRNVTKKEETN